jgi:hypothetical protein
MLTALVAFARSLSVLRDAQLALRIPSFPSSFTGWLVFLVGLVILWVIISIPVYFAGKMITKGKADFGDAMGATLGGGLAYFLVYFAVAIFLGAVIGPAASAFALVLGALVWLAIYRSSFRTNWLGAVGIVVVAWIILLVFDAILVAAFGVSFPDFFPF